MNIFGFLLFFFFSFSDDGFAARMLLEVGEITWDFVCCTHASGRGEIT